MTLRKICIMPSRMASSRFPGKPLAPLLGLPLIVHVLKRCQLYDGFERVAVATCDREILDAVVSAGGEAVMTAAAHERCADRVAEAIQVMNLDLAADDLVLMVQGDEVLMSPDMATNIVAAYEKSRSPVVNLISRLSRTAYHDDPNVVKVAGGSNGEALYFSRAAIPSRARNDDVPMYQQTGVIGFSHEFLLRFGEMPQTPLEIIESIDMLRVLENGLPLQLVKTETETIGVDTPVDLGRAEKILAADPLTKSYHEVG